MRITITWSTLLWAGALLASSPAAAQEHTSTLLTYDDDVGFFAGGEDADAVGPDFLAAGPGRTAAVWDPIRRAVLLVDESGVRGRIPARRVDGLAVGAVDGSS